MSEVALSAKRNFQATQKPLHTIDQYRFYKQAWSRFYANRVAFYCLSFLSMLVIFMIIMTQLHWFCGPSYHYAYVGLTPGLGDVPCSWRHPLGCTMTGTDWLVSLCHAGLKTLNYASLGSLLAVAIGTLTGITAGYFGGTIDTMLMRVVDFIEAIPHFYLLLIVLGPLENYRLQISTVMLALLYWTGSCRIIRGQVLVMDGQEFIQAARACGVSDWRIMYRHLFRNLFGIIISEMTKLMRSFMLLESALSFLGCGVNSPESNWGRQLVEFGANGFYDFRYWVIVPTFAIAGLLLKHIGNGTRDALDVKLMH